jgi:uncharacterized membrane protein YbhN (UPF0104 family)
MRSAWLKILVAVAVVAVLAALAYRSQSAIHLQDFDWSRLLDEIAATRKGYLLGALAAVYVAFLLRSLRWRRFSRYVGPSALSDVYSATLMGFSAMFLLGRPAEPVRPLLIARKCRMAVSSMFGIYVLERLFDTAATAVLAGSSLLLFRSQIPADGEAGWEGAIRSAGGVLLGGLAAFGLALVYFRVHGAGFMERRLTAWRAAGGWRGFVATQLAGFSDGLQAIRGVSDWWVAVFYSGLHWGLIVLIYLWIFRSFGGSLGELTVWNAMLVLAFTMVGSLVQLPGVGGGAQVASFVALTRIFRIESEPAAAAAVLSWLISFAGASLVGLPLLIREGWSMGDLRRLARAEAKAEWAGGHLTLSDEQRIVPGRGRQEGDGTQ